MTEIENRVAKALGVKPDSWMVKAAIEAVNSYEQPTVNAPPCNDPKCFLAKTMKPHYHNQWVNPYNQSETIIYEDWVVKPSKTSDI